VTAYDVDVSSGGRDLFSSRLLTNSRGELEPTVLWPQMGLDDPNSDARHTTPKRAAAGRGRPWP
jgi:hypothetical protein